MLHEESERAKREWLRSITESKWKRFKRRIMHRPTFAEERFDKLCDKVIEKRFPITGTNPQR